MGPNLLSPIVQYGFAGFSGVLLVILVWLVKRLLGILEKTNQIIGDNTQAIRNVDKRTGEELRLLRDINDKLLSRPCIVEGKS